MKTSFIFVCIAFIAFTFSGQLLAQSRSSATQLKQQSVKLSPSSATVVAHDEISRSLSTNGTIIKPAVTDLKTSDKLALASKWYVCTTCDSCEDFAASAERGGYEISKCHEHDLGFKAWIE